MFSSVQAGISTLITSSYQRYFVQPVDIPLVRQFSLLSILKCSLENPQKIVYPVFNQKRGHPVLIPAPIARGIADWQGEGGLKGYLAGFQNEAIDLPVADSYINLDLDTPGDYQKMLAAFREYCVPNRDECEALLKNVYCVPPQVYDHCQAVAELALKIARSIQEKVPGLNTQKIEAAACLHDLAKGQDDHARWAGNILTEMGFSGIDDIVSQHTDLESQEEISLESKIVYLADKYISGKQRVDLTLRYGEAKAKYGLSDGIEVKINRRQEVALKTKKELENILGHSLEKIIFA
jgi:putative nucleotidyltransferase with HDIG domain